MILICTDCTVPGLVKQEIEAAYSGFSLTYGPCTLKYELLKCTQPLMNAEKMNTVMMLITVLVIPFVSTIHMEQDASHQTLGFPMVWLHLHNIRLQK